MERSEILAKLASREITVDEAERLLRGEAQGDTPADQADNAASMRMEGNTGSADASEESHSHAAYEEIHGSGEEKAKRGGKPRWLRIKVSSVHGGQERTKVNVNIPFALVDIGMRFGQRWNRDQEVQSLMQAIREGQAGTLLEVQDDDSGDRVHIYLD